MKNGFDITEFLSNNKITMSGKKKTNQTVYKGYNDVRRGLISEVEVVNGKLKIGNKLVEVSQIDLDNSDKPFDQNKVETIKSKKLPVELKRHFLEIISTYNSYQEQMNRPSDISEVANTLGAIVEAAKELALNEAGDWFDKVTIKRNMTELQKLGQNFEKFAVDANDMDTRLHALYEDMGHILNRYYEITDIDPAVMNARLGRKTNVNESSTDKVKMKIYVKNKHTDEVFFVAGVAGEGDTYMILKSLEKIAPNHLHYFIKKV